jgi:hypothetical protein
VTPRGVPDGDMPDRPQPEYRGYPPFGDGDLDAWLAGYTAVASPAVDAALSALLAPPSRGELADEFAAMAEFRRVNGRHSFPPSHAPSRAAAPHGRRQRRRSGLSQSVTWLGTAAALVVIAVFGAATVTGRLPDPIQDIAHVVFASHPSEAPADSSHKAAHPRPDSSPVMSHELPRPSVSPSRPGDIRGTNAAIPTGRPTSREGPPRSPGSHTSSGNSTGSPGPGPGNHDRADSTGQVAHLTSYTRAGTGATPGGSSSFGAGSDDPGSSGSHGSGPVGSSRRGGDSDASSGSGSPRSTSGSGTPGGGSSGGRASASSVGGQGGGGR